MPLQGVLPSTEKVLVKLMTYQELNNYYLIGGTGLAIHAAHRLSEDIDLFHYNLYPGARVELPNLERLLQKIDADFPGTKTVDREGNWRVQLIVEGVKVDLFSEHRFHRAKNYSMLGGIRHPDEKSLLGMKIITLSFRKEWRDVYDLYHLRKKYSETEFYQGFLDIISSFYVGRSKDNKKAFFKSMLAQLKDPKFLNLAYHPEKLKGLSPIYAPTKEEVLSAFETFDFDLDYRKIERELKGKNDLTR